jgi:hypothetical protein
LREVCVSLRFEATQLFALDLQLSIYVNRASGSI